MKKVILKCEACGVEFSRDLSWYNRNKKLSQRVYCSRKCLRRPEHPCENCGKMTTNPRFCSRSCSAVVTNSAQPRRKKKIKLCTRCGEPTPRPDRKFCDQCFKLTRSVDWNTATLEDIRQATGSHNSYNSTLHQLAKLKARKAGMLNECAICGYEVKVHCCHIKPLRMFNSSALVSEVNALSNLVGLCPNHHSELDAGLLKIQL